MAGSTCVICDSEGVFKRQCEGIDMTLCIKHGVDSLICGPNLIQVSDGTLYERDLATGKFHPRGPKIPPARMIDG